MLETVVNDLSINLVEDERKIALRKFVRSAFYDVLGRFPTDSVREDWVDQIFTGASPATLVSCLVHSQEFREKQLFEQYRRFLGRTPNKEGVDFWSGLLSGGKKQEDVLAAILSSAEYMQKRGGTNEAFVRAMFLDIVQRRPLYMEAESWVGLLNSGSATRDDVARDFVTSDEFRKILIQSTYWRMLHRYPEPSAVTDLIEKFKHGLTLEQLILNLLSSREYYRRAISLSR